MSTFTEQFNIDTNASGPTVDDTNKTYNIFIQNDELQDITYSQTKVLMAEEQSLTVNPTPFEAFNTSPIDDIASIGDPSVITAMEGVNLSSYDAQRDPIHGAVINDINTIFNYINLRGETELMILEKMNMILSYLQTSARTATFATKISTYTEDKTKKIYSDFVDSVDYANMGISGVPIDATKRDKGGFLISNYQKYTQSSEDGTFTKNTDGSYEMISTNVDTPSFNLFKRSNFNISESYGDYDCIFARIKINSYDINVRAPIFVFKFYSQNTDKEYSVHFQLTTEQITTLYNNQNGTNTYPSLVYWGTQDPTKFNFSSPRAYDKLIPIAFTETNITKITYDTYIITDSTRTLSSTDDVTAEIADYTKFNSLVLKQITIEIDGTEETDSILYSFGNIIKGGLPQEFICYSS